MIRTLFVEKKTGYDTVRRRKQAEIESALSIKTEMRMLIRYNIEGLDGDDFERAKLTIFSEPPVDEVYEEEVDLSGYTVIGVELLPGQYDQRADSAAQCVQLLTRGKRPLIKTATLYAFKGADKELAEKLGKYLVNPVESRLCSFEKPSTLETAYDEAPPVPEVTGFTSMDEKALSGYHASMGFAMSLEDLAFVRDYFRGEHREPTETELKVIDTYWSDHCRHTTFGTRLTEIETDTDIPELKEALAEYGKLHDEFAKGRPDKKYPTLMDMATIGAKTLKKRGMIPDLDESEEINACSIKVTADVDGKPEDWLVMFKNETHNHPTEIEPFGGAATCLGGAIRDPLSGRVYVYQSMRVTGAGDINEPLSATLRGKLPQRTISTTAAAGFSSYGNQIGLATGEVHEMYHEGYKAKRLETGFVVGAAPAYNVVRSRPEPGDVVLLIGGETGRDGCGGATGSSKAHDVHSLDSCGAEVQKGNPLTERKIQRLFRNPEVTRLIKRCNDFGAGGVSVAVGELADGLDISLDAVPKKYQGLSSTELAISESQERMAVVIAAEDAEKMIALCAEENLGATILATVTDTGRMRMTHKGRTVVDISREFLNTNGVAQEHKAVLDDKAPVYFKSRVRGADGKGLDALKQALSSYNVCSQRGLGEMFDSTIGAATVYMPFGGKNKLTPPPAMAAKLPVRGETNTATVSAFACYPDLLTESRFVGAAYSVLMSVLKVAATGADWRRVRLTFQEFFERLGKDPVRWGRPASALLGALWAQLRLGLGAIGGKDSMSGSFEKLDVPPTLISFALAPADARKLITNVLPAGREVKIVRMKRAADGMPDFEFAEKLMTALHEQAEAGNIDFCQVTDEGGSAAAVAKSCLGDGVGFTFADLGERDFVNSQGDIFVSGRDTSAFDALGAEVYGRTTSDGIFTAGGDKASVSEMTAAYTRTFERVYPTKAAASGEAPLLSFTGRSTAAPRIKSAKPKVFIPVFPGTNCEYDTARAFERAGAEADIFVIRNRSAAEIEDSVTEIVKRISASNILMFPGGFSGGDEPDGSGKFIATTFRNPRIADAVRELLSVRDGLVLGICNGFQALVKTGLLPGGEISVQSADSPTLTFNNIARHVSQISDVRVASVKSPWLSGVSVGDVFGVAVSHGEGRFVAPEAALKSMAEKGMIATQYCDESGKPTMESPFNPNGSMYAIEGITSEDGRILGKMGHSERIGKDMYKNIPARFDMKIFESGVKYFK